MNEPTKHYESIQDAMVAQRQERENRMLNNIMFGGLGILALLAVAYVWLGSL